MGIELVNLNIITNVLDTPYYSYNYKVITWYLYNSICYNQYWRVINQHNKHKTP